MKLCDNNSEPSLIDKELEKMEGSTVQHAGFVDGDIFKVAVQLDSGIHLELGGDEPTPADTQWSVFRSGVSVLELEMRLGFVSSDPYWDGKFISSKEIYEATS